MKNERKTKSHLVRRKLPSTNKLGSNETLDQLSKVGATGLSEGSAHRLRLIGKGDNGVLPAAVRFLSHEQDGHIHMHSLCSVPEENKEKMQSVQIALAVHMHGGYKADVDMADSSSIKKPKDGPELDLQGMNINLPSALSSIAKDYFRVTKWKTLSKFVTEALRRECAKDADRIKALGYKLPDWVFKK